MRTMTSMQCLLMLVVFGLALPVHASEQEWGRLTAQTRTNYQQGQYQLAINSARQALAEAENTFGPEHINVATSLNDLALMYTHQGQLGEAEPLYQRSLKIYQQAVGADNTHVAIALTNLADLYKVQNKYLQAEPLYLRALAIFENSLGPEHQNVATVLTGLTGVYFTLGQYDKAEAMSYRALSIQQKILGPNHPALATSLNNLAFMQVNQGHYSQAEPLYLRALDIQEQASGPDHPNVAYILNNLGELYGLKGEYARAEQILTRALSIRELALGTEHPEVAVSLVNLATSYRAQGRYAQAESLFKRALAIIEKAFGPEHTHVAAVLNQLALVYYEQGQYTQVEALFKRALMIRENSLGFEHPDVSKSLNNLAGLYTVQGKYAQAEPLRERALAILKKIFGPIHPDIAAILNDSAYSYFVEQQYAKALPLYQQSLSIREQVLGLEHPDVGNTLRDLATVYGKQGRYDEAMPLFERALTIAEKHFGPDHAAVATVLHLQAELYKAQQQYAKAQPLYQRSLAIAQKVVGQDHPGIALSLNSISDLYRLQGRYSEALDLARRASAITRRRMNVAGDVALWESFSNRPGFYNHLALLAVNPENEPPEAIADEALQIVQLEQASGTASAIDKMAARFAAGDDDLANLVKRKQDAADRRSRDETRLLKAVGAAQRIVADERRLQDDIVLLDNEIAMLDAELMRHFPDFQELTRREPVSAAQVRSLLRPNEALLVYALGQSSYLWVVKPDSVVFMPLKVDLKQVSAQIAGIRTEMDFDYAGRALPVSVDVLHELYQRLFAPALPHLTGVSHIMVVPAGPLQSLPLGMLVVSPATNQDYRQLDWLALHYALTVLPSVSSLQAFRQFAKADKLQEPFAGFGDPQLGQGATRLDVAAVYRNLAVNATGSVTEHAAEIADVEMIRQAPRLPETADELRAMAIALGADDSSIWLQERATETRVKQLDLSRYRTIAFATHGVMAGELKGAGESGLILSPPEHGTVEDDGYLAASEIARLKLNADWIVLSACNTAATDGTPGAEGLSGLGKAFFYAGARSLLVSNWPVASSATVLLTTSMMSQYRAHPEAGKAAALQQAMKAMMNDSSHPEYAHPIFWAPFVVVGEGGAAK